MYLLTPDGVLLQQQSSDLRRDAARLGEPEVCFIHSASSDRERRTIGIYIDTKLICKILEFLPPAVEHLDLDTGGTERHPSPFDAHQSCSHLARQLLHVKHVRPSLTMYWPQLLYQAEQTFITGIEQITHPFSCATEI